MLFKAYLSLPEWKTEECPLYEIAINVWPQVEDKVNYGFLTEVSFWLNISAGLLNIEVSYIFQGQLPLNEEWQALIFADPYNSHCVIHSNHVSKATKEHVVE